MSFGWSFGDVISGIKVVWDIYEAVSDGPLNAQLEATQFFDEFGQIINCLDRWKQKAESEQDEQLSNLHQQLREQCETFIKRHILLIQGANSRSTTTREGRSTWLRKVPFSRDQVILLYQRVEWPLERKEVSRLRKKLTFFLQVSTHNAVIETNERMRDIWILQQSNLKLVESHLQVVSSIAQNLKMVTIPRESGQLDYSMLRQFEHAILPPQPIRAIEAPPAENHLPFRPQQLQIAEGRYAPVSSASSSSSQDARFIGQDDRFIQERLENIAKRGMNGSRAGDLVSSAGSRERRYSVVGPVLEHLREIRNGFGDALGFLSGAVREDSFSSTLADAQGALQEELKMWNQLAERIQYDVKRREQFLNRIPMRQMSTVELPAPAPNLSSRNTQSFLPTPSDPIPIPIPSPGASPPLSPTSSPLISGSPSSESGLGSPERNRFLSNNLSSSNSSSSGIQSIRISPAIQVILEHQRKKYLGSIQLVSKLDNGEVYSIHTLSRDGSIDLRHSIDRSPAAATETSMKPFLDNVHVDRRHRNRVQFQGTHILRITRRDNQGGSNSEERRGLPNPVYKFDSKNDYLKFQFLLLGKEVALCSDVELIRTKTNRDTQCRLSTVSILVDPIYRARSILYFRSGSREIQYPAFVEWRVNQFQEPGEPLPRSRTLTLESSNGNSLSRTSLSRRSTQGSVTTIGSLESTAAAHARLAERSSGRGVRSLVIEFHEAKDCHDFWEEFVRNENVFEDTGLTELG